MANYGDAALNLPADWNRKKISNSELAYLTVGHTDGKADIHLKDDPEKSHAFAFVDPKHPMDLDIRRYEGYDFVTQEKWSSLLYKWNAEDKLEVFGQLVMAIPAEKHAELVAEDRAKRARTAPKDPREEALAIADGAGIEVTDGEGRRLVRGSKRR